MRFEGCCTYPHGCATTMGLMLAVAGGLAATGYAFASCRFVIIDFESRWGDFAEVCIGAGAGDGAGGSNNQSYRVAAGFFTWLQPNTGAYDQGFCVGYRQSMLECLEGDGIFDAVRVMAVLSVLMSFMMITWLFLLTSLSMTRREIWGMRVVFFTLTCLVGLSFLVFRSSLCNNVGDGTDCRLDEGGLVTIAATILWLVGLLISCIFVKPLGSDLVLIDGELRSHFGERQEERDRQAQVKATAAARKKKEKRAEKDRQAQEREDRNAAKQEEKATRMEEKKRLQEDRKRQKAVIAGGGAAAGAAAVATAGVLVANNSDDEDAVTNDGVMNDAFDGDDYSVDQEYGMPGDATADDTPDTADNSADPEGGVEAEYASRAMSPMGATTFDTEEGRGRGRQKYEEEVPMDEEQGGRGALCGDIDDVICCGGAGPGREPPVSRFARNEVTGEPVPPTVDF